jgi:hypothetical protein
MEVSARSFGSDGEEDELDGSRGGGRREGALDVGLSMRVGEAVILADCLNTFLSRPLGFAATGGGPGEVEESSGGGSSADMFNGEEEERPDDAGEDDVNSRDVTDAVKSGGGEGAEGRELLEADLASPPTFLPAGMYLGIGFLVVTAGAAPLELDGAGGGGRLAVRDDFLAKAVGDMGGEVGLDPAGDEASEGASPKISAKFSMNMTRRDVAIGDSSIWSAKPIVSGALSRFGAKQMLKLAEVILVTLEWAANALRKRARYLINL